MQDPSNWSFQTPVQFDILVRDGSPEIWSSTAQENQTVNTYICLWEDRYELARHLLGAGIYGIPPVSDANRPQLVARRCVISGISGDGFSDTDYKATYRYAALNTTYLLPEQFDPGSGSTNLPVYMTVSGESGGEYMTVPGRDVLWIEGPDNGKALKEPQQIFVPITNWTVTVRQWQNPDFDLMDNDRGKINSEVINWIAGRPIGIGWLAFESYSVNTDITIDGESAYEVQLRFKEKVRSWNRLLARDLTWNRTNPLLYNDADFKDWLP